MAAAVAKIDPIDVARAERVRDVGNRLVEGNPEGMSCSNASVVLVEAVGGDLENGTIRPLTHKAVDKFFREAKAKKMCARTLKNFAVALSKPSSYRPGVITRGDVGYSVPLSRGGFHLAMAEADRLDNDTTFLDSSLLGGKGRSSVAAPILPPRGSTERSTPKAAKAGRARHRQAPSFRLSAPADASVMGAFQFMGGR